MRWRNRIRRYASQLTAPANQTRLLWAVRVRWLVIGGFFTLACLAWAGGVITRIALCGVAAAVAAVANAINHLSVRRLRYVHAVTALALIGDVLLITALVVLTGGVLSPFVMMYVVQVVATAMLVGFIPALMSAALSVASCGVALWLLPADVASGVLGFVLTAAPPLHYQVVWVGFLLYCLGLLAFLGGYISTRLQRSERDLAHSHARMARALASLRAAHADLAATYVRLRTTEAQLVHDEKMRALGHFVAGIAHELNNPIAVVTANIDHLHERLWPLQPVLAGHVATVAEAARHDGDTTQQGARRLAAFVDELPVLLTDCIDGMRRASEIVRSLHAFSRSGATDRFQPTDLHAMLDRTLTLVRHRVGKGVVVERVYGDIPLVECLQSQLDQVFLNLLLNAADAVGDAGTIVVSTARLMNAGSAPRGADVAISVRDSGVGIPQHVLSHIFDPFFTTKPVGKGAGLGLSVSYGIVTRHGGAIAVESHVGCGATFTVSLPVIQREGDDSGPGA